MKSNKNIISKMNIKKNLKKKGKQCFAFPPPKEIGKFVLCINETTVSNILFQPPVYAKITKNQRWTNGDDNLLQAETYGLPLQHTYRGASLVFPKKSSDFIITDKLPANTKIKILNYKKYNLDTATGYIIKAYHGDHKVATNDKNVMIKNEDIWPINIMLPYANQTIGGEPPFEPDFNDIF